MNFFKHKYFYFYLITLTLTLILFEIGSYLTNLSIIKKNSFYTKKNDLVTNDSNFFDNRTRLKYFLDQKKNLEIFTATHPEDTLNHNDTNNILYPLAGVSNIATIHCNELGFWKSYKSDRYGFNNPDEVWNNKSPKLFMLGDSFLHGECVHEKQTFAGYMRSNYSNNNVVNLGYRGIGST